MALREVEDGKQPAEPFCLNVEQIPPQSLVHLQPSKQPKKQFKAASGEKLNGGTRLTYEKEKLMECGVAMCNDTASTKNCAYTYDDSHMEPGGAVSLNKKLEDLNNGQGVSQNSWSENVNNTNPNDEDEGSNVTTLLNETFKTDQIPGATEPADLTASPDTTWYRILSFSPSDEGNSIVIEVVDRTMNGELVCPAMKLCGGEGEMVVSPLCSCGGGLENSELVTGRIWPNQA